MGLILPKLESDLAKLRQLASAWGLGFDDASYESMRGFVRLLLEWNHSINLVSRQDEHRIVTRHIAESIGLLTLIDLPYAQLVMDIGSGGGFPAIPMKILRPDLSVTLVESNGKKAAFLKNVGTKLLLQGYQVIHKRIEAVNKDSVPPQFLITARALADLPVLWRWAAAHLATGGQLLAIKGGDANREIEAVADSQDVAEVIMLTFPEWLNIEKSRNAIMVKKK